MFHNDMGFVEKTDVELDKFTNLGWFLHHKTFEFETRLKIFATETF